jgi:selenophosphate synthase
MAYLMTHFWPGGTEDQYNATVAVVHPPGGLPDGQAYHAAGPTDGGFLIAVVWDSKEQAERFVQEKLIASMPIEGGFEGQPDERTAEISTLLKA